MAQQWRQQTAGVDFPGGESAGPWAFAATLTPAELSRAHKWLVISGILALLVGVVAITVPIIASVTVAIFVGWVLVVGAITMGIHAISNRATWRAIEALLTLIAGLYILVLPLNGTVTLTFVLAVWFFASGVMRLILAWQGQGAPDNWITVLGGVLSVILGFLIAGSLPSSAAWAIGLLVGINLIFWGFRALVGAQLMKRYLEV
jgi:uncharacterized membrane protein HdeD (DUF308 family)